MYTTKAHYSETVQVASLLKVWGDTSDWFGTLSSVPVGSVGALIAVSPAGTAVAAEGHRIGEDRVGIKGTTREYGCAVLHFIISTTFLDKVA